jgi:hypothetical protein
VRFNKWRGASRPLSQASKQEDELARRSLFKKAITRMQRETMLATKAAYQRLQPHTPGLHVFVAGMQRSGTNMLMDVLERSRGTEVVHESDARAFDNYEMRPAPMIHQLAATSHAPVFVIKALCELDQLSRLMDEFSPAKTVWLVRDYNDAVSSALVSFSNFARQVGRIADDRDSDGWRGRGMSDATHARVRSLYTPDMDDATAAALIWYLRNVLYFEQQFERDERVLLAHYENLVTQPQLEFPRIFQFLGLHYTPFVSSQVFASSIRRREPPVIAPPVRELCDALSARFRALTI